MDVLILNGSPHKNGTTAHLLQRFQEGAEEAGHEITRFDTAFMDIHPCTGCERCGCGENPCVFQDDMQKIVTRLKSADAIVLATPTYYFGISAQLKVAMDRFYQINDFLLSHPKKMALITCCAGIEPETVRGIVGTYEENANYLTWEDRGKVCALGCGTPDDLAPYDYLDQAYELGKAI